MTVKEILQFADELVFAHTGKHLDDLQETVIKGVWQGQTYEQIANECNRSESRVRDVGYKLWQVLSEKLGEDISKNNFRSTIERICVQSSQVIGVGNHHEFNFCTQTLAQPHQQNQPKNQPQSNSYDLTLAPKVTYFYGRESELKTLSSYLTNPNARLISVLGLPGVGKTTLVKQCVDLNLQRFDVVVWKSIKFSQSLESILNQVLTGMNPESILGENNFTQFFNLLCKQRCLIILDDVQELFISGQFAGQYKSDHKDYKTLFTRSIEIEHQSNLILISQEQCQEMLCLDEELYPVKCLELEGLDTIEVFRNQGLQQEKSWETLLDLYEGNPVYLKEISSLIKKVFLGRVSEFLAEDSLILTEDIKSHLRELLNCLSPIEKQIVLKLSKSNQFLLKEEIRQDLEISSIDLINGIQSLDKRYLLRKIEGEKLLLSVSSIYKEYIKTFWQDE